MRVLRLAPLCLATALAVLGTLAPVVASADVSGSPSSASAGLASQEERLIPEVGVEPGGHYGSKVAISGDTAVVGVPLGSLGWKGKTGYARVFGRSGHAWTSTGFLTAPDAGPNDSFGSAIAISGDTIAVGAPYAGISPPGYVYVYVRTDRDWVLQQQLAASNPSYQARFGGSIAISGDTMVVGAPAADGAGSMDGAAYVFTRSGGLWTEQQKLTASGPPGGSVGCSVAISGDTILVGASGRPSAVGTNAGSAFVFTRSAGVWSEQQQLTASDAAAWDSFGTSVALSRETAVVGSPYDDTNAGDDAGSAYVFTPSEGMWTEQQKLVVSGSTAHDDFGVSVAIDGDTVVVGAPHPDYESDPGAAYTFEHTGGAWVEREKLLASDGAPHDYFGNSVGISGSTKLVGAPYHDTEANNDAGSAYAFVPDTTPPVTTSTITPSCNAAGWNSGEVTIWVDATDDWSGVASSQYRLVGESSWTTCSGRFSVLAEGTSTYEYRSIDIAGNVEAVKTLVVHRDSQRPATRAYPSTVRKGRRVKLAYMVHDPLPGCAEARITLRVYRGRTLKTTIEVPGTRACNTKVTSSWRCRLPKGRYTFKAYAVDIAGNAQSRVEGARLTVR